MKNILFSTVLLTVLLCLYTKTYGYVGVDMTLKDQIDDADVVIVGEVSQIDYEQGTGEIPVVTHITLAPVSLITANGEEDMGSEFKISYWGGVVPLPDRPGEYTVYASSANPGISIGEEIIVLLANNGRSFIPFVGGPRGLLRIQGDGSVRANDGRVLHELSEDGRLRSIDLSASNNASSSARTMRATKSTIISFVKNRIAHTGRSEEMRNFFSQPLPSITNATPRTHGINK